MVIFLDDYRFNLIHRTNKKIKRVSLSIENKDEILIRTPLKFKAHNLKEIALSHKDWILKTIHKVPAKNQFEFTTAGVIPFMGINYPIELIQKDEIKNIKVVFEDDIFYFYHNPTINQYDNFIDALKKFYKKVAHKYIDKIFDEWCFKTKLYPNNITYRYAKRRWGSCSFENNISINYMLLQFPKSAIEYVILHELCHIKEKNHSKRFYNLLSLYMDDYKQKEEILKKKIF